MKSNRTKGKSSAWNNLHAHCALAQSCHCEFCYGMHLSCKSTSVTPDTMVWCCVKGKFLRRHLEE